MNNILVSPSPHLHTKTSTKSLMRDVVIALLPAVVVSVLFYGWSELLVLGVSVASCVLLEFLITKYLLRRPCTVGDWSAVITGVLLALNLPASTPWWVVFIGAVVAIGVAKMTFGGLGQNLFNPAIAGRVFLLIAYPAQMTTWPTPQGFNGSYVDAETGATPLYYLKHIVKAGDSSVIDQLPSLMDSFLGVMGGSLGEVSAAALLIGGIFLICCRVITWHIPVAILGTVACFCACTGLAGALPEGLDTCHYIGYELLSGGLMLGAFFMATDYVTSPMSAWGKIIFGIGIGFIVMVIRTWGNYPEGMSFAILIMNACVPLLNKIRPQHFGEPKKA